MNPRQITTSQRVLGIRSRPDRHSTSLLHRAQLFTMAKEAPEWLNLANEIRLYWLEEGNRAVVHFVDTPGPVVEGWVRDLLKFTQEHWEGWRESNVLLDDDTYAYQIESASEWIFCNHENRPDHAKVVVKDLYFSVEPKTDPLERDVKAEVTIRRKGWENG